MRVGLEPISELTGRRNGLCFAAPVPDYLNCPVCLTIFDKPMNLSGAAHTFCVVIVLIDCSLGLATLKRA
jgi:hypothetical protein